MSCILKSLIFICIHTLHLAFLTLKPWHLLTLVNLPPLNNYELKHTKSIGPRNYTFGHMPNLHAAPIVGKTPLLLYLFFCSNVSPKPWSDVFPLRLALCWIKPRLWVGRLWVLPNTHQMAFRRSPANSHSPRGQQVTNRLSACLRLLLRRYPWRPVSLLLHWRSFPVQVGMQDNLYRLRRPRPRGKATRRPLRPRTWKYANLLCRFLVQKPVQNNWILRGRQQIHLHRQR